MKKSHICLIASLATFNSYADDKELPGIPVFVYSHNQETKNDNNNYRQYAALGNKNSEEDNISSNILIISDEQITGSINKVKKTICSAVKNGEVKVYFSFDAEAGIFGIGASAGAGFEVTFKCNNT